MALVDMRILKAERRAEELAADRKAKLSRRLERLEALKKQIAAIEAELKAEEEN